MNFVKVRCFCNYPQSRAPSALTGPFSAVAAKLPLMSPRTSALEERRLSLLQGGVGERSGESTAARRGERALTSRDAFHLKGVT